MLAVFVGVPLAFILALVAGEFVWRICAPPIR